jgi:hypothetical protein
MKNISYIVVITVLISLIGLNGLYAQKISRVHSNFRKLEIYISRIDELVKNFNDERARNFISQAKIELEKARRLLFNTDSPRVGLAQILMAKAKNLTDQAARLVLRKPFANLKSQLDNLISKAESIVSISKNDEAHYLLNQAKKFRRLSYTSFSAGKVVKGQEYYRISYFFANKCVEFLSKGGKNIQEQILELDLSIRQLLMQAEDLLDANTQKNLYTMLQEAEKYYEEARQLAEEGDPELALRRLRLVKRFVYRIFDQAERAETTPQTRTENSLYSLRSLLQALQNDVNQSSNPNARKLLDNAWTLLREAELASENRNYKQAQMKISLSQRFANNVFRKTRNSKTENSTDIQFRIDETRKLLNLQADQVQGSLKVLHGEAEKILINAQNNLENDNTIVAFQLVQAATRMTARIQRELRQSLPNDIEMIALEKKYKRVQNMLDQMTRNRDFSKEYGPVLIQLRQFTVFANQYMQSGDYLLAEEYLNTVFEQIRQYTNKWRETAK